MPKYKVQTYIPAESEEGEFYDSKEDALKAVEHLITIHSENYYEVVEIEDNLIVDHEDAMSEFDDRFGPIISPPNVEYFEDYEEAIEAAKKLDEEVPANHFWTIVEYEDEMWVCEGNRLVNRMHMWLVTTEPHNFEGHEFLWYRDEESEDE